MKKNRKKFKFLPLSLCGRLMVYVYFIALTLPLSFAILTAFKTEQERVINPIGLPESFSFDNFFTAWEVGKLLSATKNSIIIAGGGTILCMLLSIIVTYCLNRLRGYKIGTVLYMVVLSSIFIPGVGTATGLLLRRNLGLYDNLHGEIICASLNIATAVFMISSFLRTFPAELEEAAILDGATDTQICFRIVTPLVKPVIVSMAILTFRGMWNDGLGPMLTLRSEELYTIPMSLLLNFIKGTTTIYTTMFAGVIITAVPVVILFCLFQKEFTNAMVGGVKG